jgi:hypothetical protein
VLFRSLIGDFAPDLFFGHDPTASIKHAGRDSNPHVFRGAPAEHIIAARTGTPSSSSIRLEGLGLVARNSRRRAPRSPNAVQNGVGYPGPDRPVALIGSETRQSPSLAMEAVIPRELVSRKEQHQMTWVDATTFDDQPERALPLVAGVCTGCSESFRNRLKRK